MCMGLKPVHFYKSEKNITLSFAQNHFIERNDLSLLNSIHPRSVSNPTIEVLPPLLTDFFFKFYSVKINVYKITNYFDLQL